MGEGLKRACAAAKATQPVRLTPAKRRTLEYVGASEFVSLWPKEFANNSVRKALEAAGLIEKFGSDPGVFGFLRFRITEAGRQALAQR